MSLDKKKFYLLCNIPIDNTKVYNSLNISKYNVELYQSSFIFLWMSYRYAPFLTYCHTHSSLSKWRHIRYVMWAFKWIWHCFRTAQDKLKRKKMQETLFLKSFYLSDAFHRNIFWSYFQVKWYTNKSKSRTDEP